jgi:hypothetical protein
MNRSLVLSWPARALAAAIVLLLVGVAAGLSGERDASAVTIFPGPFTPFATTTTGQCSNAAMDSCTGAGTVTYEFNPTGIPANAEIILYEVKFDASSSTGAGGFEVQVTHNADANFTSNNIIVPIGVGPIHIGYQAGPSDFDIAWTPMANVRARFTYGHGDQVQFDNVQLIAHVQIPDPANLAVDIDGPAYSNSGGSFVYTIEVQNLGSGDAHDVSLNTTLGSQLISLSSQGCSNGPLAIPTCDIGTVAAGGSKTVTLNVFSALNASGDKTTTVTATTTSTDSNIFNNTDSIVTSIAVHRSVTVCKTWEDNGDATPEPQHEFLFSVDWDGKPGGASNVTRNVAEGATVCALISVNAEQEISVNETALAGWTNAAGYPKHQLGAGALVTGPTATFGPGVEEVTFVNRTPAEAAGQVGSGPNPSPTQEDPTPEGKPDETVTVTPTATVTPDEGDTDPGDGPDGADNGDSVATDPGDGGDGNPGGGNPGGDGDGNPGGGNPGGDGDGSGGPGGDSTTPVAGDGEVVTGVDSGEDVTSSGAGIEDVAGVQVTPIAPAAGGGLAAGARWNHVAGTALLLGTALMAAAGIVLMRRRGE